MPKKQSTHTIENDILKVTVKSTGAELCSLIDKRDGMEHLWQADPEVWGKHAPILFPVIGKVQDDVILIDGKQYPHPKHGFFRPSTPEVISHKKNEIWFELTDSEATQKMFPFSFQFKTGYRLENDTLHHLFEVVNTGRREMPFCLGGHPAFRIPLFEDELITDYKLRFEKSETVSRLLLNETGFFNGEKEPMLKSESVIPITKDLFKDDALVFEDLKSRTIYLESDNHGKWLSVAFDDFPMLGIWAQPGAEFVCIEPWIGRADDAGEQVPFDEKPGVEKVAKGEIFRASFSVRLWEG